MPVRLSRRRRTVCGVDEKHHLVPKSYLKRFADGRRVVLARRDDLATRLTTSVDAAVKEGGFYDVPQGLGLPTRYIEDLLGEVEGRAANAIDAVLAGDFPPSMQTRMDIALFAALQTTRGWRFRNDFNQVAQEAARAAAKETTRAQVERTLRRTGRSVTGKSIDRWHEVTFRFEGVRALPGRSMHLRFMLESAMEIALPILLARPWRLYEFRQPGIVTSDQPIAMWSPPGGTLGWGRATIVWLPLTPTIALAFGSTAAEEQVAGSDVRRRQVVQALAEAAERWVILPPTGDDPLHGVEVRNFEPIASETIGTEEYGDLVREVVRVGRQVSRP